jgi:hypothetical protein
MNNQRYSNRYNERYNHAITRALEWDGIAYQGGESLRSTQGVFLNDGAKAET